MNKVANKVRLICGMFLCVCEGLAFPFNSYDIVSTNEDLIIDYPPHVFEQLCLLPHHAGVCDLICTGMVLSTNDGHSAEVAVGEVVWGSAATSNITVRHVYYGRPGDELLFKNGHRYLLFAFTNNWWTNKRNPDVSAFHSLYEYLPPTQRPQNNAVFSDYRLMDPLACAVDFSLIDYDGTNHWDATRTFITNFTDIARQRHDLRAARDLIYDTLARKELWEPLPRFLVRNLSHYKRLYYEYPKKLLGDKGEDNGPPPQ